ncbi:MAG: ABC transporter permease [Firmicutes bacterium]|nr:ABC transporter permease [Bacillota bacterium]
MSQARGARYNPVVRLISYHYTPPNLAAVEGRYRYVLNQFINQQVYWHRNPAARDMTLAELMELPGFPFDNIPGYLLRSTGNFTIRLDTYLQLGFLYRTISPERYNEIRAFESRTGMRVIFPMIDNDRYFNPDAHPNDRVVRNPRPHDANVWWRYELDADVLVENYLWRYRYVLDADGNFVYNGTERETERYLATFITNIDGIERSVRVLYYNYYYFLNGRHPVYWFGLNQSGEDIFILLVVGIRTSFALAILVAAMILVLGVILGAIQGYFGGWVDLIGQRITEIIDFIPFVVVSMLFVFYLGTIVPAFMTLVILYVFTSWTGMANLTRLQFYRFKGREYVLAARTLGARDRRLMFRHILPNGIGMIITSAVMLIPAVIVGEATLAFLGIIDITGGTFLGFGGASLGSMLTQGQEVLMRLPHVVLFPSIAISLIMISFNLFGNGLRDALNPALRGKE